VVFHAAAYKHVPVMELHPQEAMTTNVTGTRNLAEAARAFKAERFVLVSTDKAVNPSSVMGASKRLAEMVVTNIAQEGDTIFSAVRFGNVLASRGSVVPLFAKQVREGGPITVTHPDATRYFMTIEEAVALICQAAALGVGGETFVLEMGEPVRIMDLAKRMRNLLADSDPEKIEIVVTGLRSGEKLHEDLWNAGEELLPVAAGIRKARYPAADPGDLALQDEIRLLEELAAERGDTEEIVKRLFAIALRSPDVTRAHENP
jgi:FlaA1/EpsC-like NDP-sugar epimerase